MSILSTAAAISDSTSTGSSRPRVGGAAVRRARLQDAVNIFELVNSLSGDGTLLRRSYAEICENVRDFHVAESEAGVFLGCGALHLYGPHLEEVRSIVVKPEAKGQGAGGKLLKALLAEAEDQGVVCVSLFTRIPDFFFHFGFPTASRISPPPPASAPPPAPPCPTRSTRTARPAPASTPATRSPWSAGPCPRW